MKKLIAVIALLTVIIFSCKKKTKDTPVSEKRTGTDTNAMGDTTTRAETEPYVFSTIGHDSVIPVLKPDTIFWVTDLQKFAKDSSLTFFNEFLDEDGNFSDGEDFYMLGHYERYSFAIAYENPHIAIKDKNRYRVWRLPSSIPVFSNIYHRGKTELWGRKITLLEGCYETRWSLTSSLAGLYNQCYKSILVIDLQRNEILFNKIFSNYEERVADIEAFKAGKDSLQYENQWFNYTCFNNNGVFEFYKIPEPELNCEELRLEVSDIKGKPEFYYKYEEKNKRWVKKINNK